ncbi:hypothetical protein HDV06_000594 [Boothiomyces sp. JEL0866]|nr:hypothetical protein HDV06_000594 [Boothiomyces sp. JEL0866]
MKRATLSAKRFALESYPNEAFDTFTIDNKIEEGRPKSTEVISSAKKRSNQIKEDQPNYNLKWPRPKVPHDATESKVHSSYCNSFTGGMVTAAIAYHPRRNLGPFGKTNRMQHLNELFKEGLSVCPKYPAAYHGQGGEGRPFAVGLTEAGCPSSNESLIAPCFKESKRKPGKDIVTISVELENISAKEHKEFNGYKNFYNVLLVNQNPYELPKISPPDVPIKNSAGIPTRYSANLEWYRATSKLARHLKTPYKDDEAERKRDCYKRKLTTIRNRNEVYG